MFSLFWTGSTVLESSSVTHSSHTKNRTAAFVSRHRTGFFSLAYIFQRTSIPYVVPDLVPASPVEPRGTFRGNVLETLTTVYYMAPFWIVWPLT